MISGKERMGSLPCLGPSGSMFEKKGKRCSESLVDVCFGNVAENGGISIIKMEGCYVSQINIFFSFYVGLFPIVSYICEIEIILKTSKYLRNNSCYDV